MMKWLLMASAAMTAVNAFSPPPSIRQATKSALLVDSHMRFVLNDEKSLSNRKWSLFSLVDEDRMMTVEDQSVLFGEEDKNDNNSIANGNVERPFPESHRKLDRTGNVLTDPAVPLNPLDHSTTNPLINKLHTMRLTLNNAPELWDKMSRHCPDLRALLDEHDNIDLTFAEMNDKVTASADMFRDLLKHARAPNVAIFAENCASWLQIDHGLQRAGGISAVRGADAPLEELRYIYDHCDSAGVVVLQGPKLLRKLMSDKNHADHPDTPLGLSNVKYGPVKTVILMQKEKQSMEQLKTMIVKEMELNDESEIPFRVEFFSDLLEQYERVNGDTLPFPNVNRDDLATIVYTSGTTGHPKGVMLTHGNLIHQMGHRLSPSLPFDQSEPLPGEVTVSLLPVWHITERTFELWVLSRGCHVVYSSIRTFRDDLAKHRPQWMVLVPRVLEKIAMGVQEKFAARGPAVQSLMQVFSQTTKIRNRYKKIANGLVVVHNEETDQDIILPGPLQQVASKMAYKSLTPFHKLGSKLVWSKVQQGFGGRIKTIICGGSALAGSLEEFYETCGINICVGYGLTECSPLVAYRRGDANLPAAGCVGKPAGDTQIRIVNVEEPADRERPSLPVGKIGLVLAKGPQVMRGYYKDPRATSRAIDEYGWFDTGDLGRFNPATGDLILTGRAKDTIVLSNGENIEPQPLEDAISSASTLIEQVMLTGQDGRRLVAIAVLNPAELMNAGYITDKALQKANENINNPQCTKEEYDIAAEKLQNAGDALRKNNNMLQQALEDAVKQATSSSAFRPWERVQHVYFTLEPFAMINGELTQSYKIKRPAVMKRYQDVLPK